MQSGNKKRNQKENFQQNHIEFRWKLENIFRNIDQSCTKQKCNCLKTLVYWVSVVVVREIKMFFWLINRVKGIWKKMNFS